MATKPGHLRLLFILFFSAACRQEQISFYDGAGMRPVYVSLSELKNIGNEAPRPVENPGAPFFKDSLLFILEQGKGIHVFNVGDTLNVKNRTFIRIPAVTDFTVDQVFIYADSRTDLVTINISDLMAAKEVNRIEMVLQPLLYPPDYVGFFECVDLPKGAVVAWENASLEDAKCTSSQ